MFTRDLARANRVSGQMRAGICWGNTYRAISPIARFDGFGQSGYGREAGMQALLDYTRTRIKWTDTTGEPMSNPFVICCCGRFVVPALHGGPAMAPCARRRSISVSS